MSWTNVVVLAGKEGSSIVSGVALTLTDTIAANAKVETARIFFFLLIIAFLRYCSKNTAINSIIRSDTWLIYFESARIYFRKIFWIAAIFY